jgi:ornithine cyclodeaminase/alanine dehydrogenase-like protein (mu-crystallin family)
MPIPFRLLNEADVKAVLSMSDLIDTMTSALRQFSSGGVVQPVRSVIAVGSEHAFFGTMPAYVRQPAAMGAKLVTVFGSNATRGLPSHLASILLLDPETGALRAILDGRYITEARTAAVSAVSSRLLARDDASTLAIIGSGVQARSHLEALSHVHRLREVRVWSPNADRRRAFVSECAAGASYRLTAADTAEQAVRDADVIALVTSSPTPVIDDAWVKPGAHVVAVGACRPTQREIPPELTTRARLFVDSRAAALVEAGDVVMAINEGRFQADHILAELGELVAGAPGRLHDDDITIFKSLGLAVEDVTTADLAWRRAVERGIGQMLAL